VWLGATEGGLVVAGMRLYPLARQPLGFGYLCASHPLFEFELFVTVLLITFHAGLGKSSRNQEWFLHHLATLNINL